MSQFRSAALLSLLALCAHPTSAEPDSRVVQPLRSQPTETLARECVHAVVGDAFGALLHVVQAHAGQLQLGTFGSEYGIVGHDVSTLPAAATGKDHREPS